MRMIAANVKEGFYNYSFAAKRGLDKCYERCNAVFMA